MAKQISLRERHPEFYKADSETDRRGSKRTIPMDVLVLGMPRTGTASMRRALEMLGIPTFHSLDFMNNIQDCTLWDEALDAKYASNPPRSLTRSEWDSIIGHYGAVCDVPAVAFAEDLISIYPEAKVVLVEHDIEEWYKNFNDAVIVNVWSPLIWFCALVDPYFVGPMVQTHKRWARGWFKSNNAEDMRRNARTMYLKHYEMVKRITPPERLLVFRLRDGWRPLCEFLDEDPPWLPFPRINDSEAWPERMKLLAWRGLKNGVWRAGKVLVTMIIFVVTWWYLDTLSKRDLQET